MDKVVIGIVAKNDSGNYSRSKLHIRNELKQAIFDNNAIALGILPTNEKKVFANNSDHFSLTQKEKEDLIYQLDLCDGIILQGGVYSDECEVFIAKYCYDFNKPLLGICAGMHNITRSRKGIVDKIGTLEHQSEEEYVHEIIIENKSLLYKIIGKEKIMVNSRHIKCTKDAKDLKIVAYSINNIPEAVESKNKRFYLGVQFHPESLYKKDENMNNIFKYFIKECEKNKGK